MNTIATKFVVKGGLALATSAAGALIGMPLIAHLGLAFSGRVASADGRQVLD